MLVKVLSSINLSDVPDINSKSVTIDKVYKVIGEYSTDFRIVNDFGEPIIYPKSIFKIVEDGLPIDWHRLEVGPDHYYVDPKPLSRPGFYEDLFDGKEDAVQVFHDYVIENDYLTESDWQRQWVNGRLINKFGIG